MQILGFSPRVYEEVGRFFREHPVIQAKVLRSADLGSPAVRIDGVKCERCGWEWDSGLVFKAALGENMAALGEELPASCVPGDLIKALQLTHAWDQASRSVYCGGSMRFETRAAPLLTPIG